MSSTSSTDLGISSRVATKGSFASSARQPLSLRTPRLRNLSEICVRKASLGTTTRSRSTSATTIRASIVSVLPVPVGITMVAGAEEAVQWPRAACIAPICGFLRPGWTTMSPTRRSSAKVNAPRQDSRISAHPASSFSIGMLTASAAAGLIQTPGVGSLRNSARLEAAGWRSISSAGRSTSVLREMTATSRRPSGLRRNSPRTRFSVNSFAEAISLRPGWPSFLTEAPWIFPAIENWGGSEISRSSLKSVSTLPPGKCNADP
ncbi:hypothetical protein J2T08_005788 [Neorhizobium galegae]|nr:hypothetical protein [Neorhizobium galegae]